MGDRESLSRLTDREKVCLRQWLQHKSAKEIAADLRISHHAVEKRLKMARTKLGATSSLEAARMLCEAEGYGQAVAQSPDLASDAVPLHSDFTRLAITGVVIMVLIGAIVLGLLSQPAAFSQAPNSPAAGAPAQQLFTPVSGPTAGTEAALRSLVAGLASGSPDYDKLSPQFAQIVRQDLPVTHPMFSSRGGLKSVTFLGRAMGGDIYKLTFANGGAIMSAALDPQGRMAGGILLPVTESAPIAGTEAALRSLVAGLASGSPDYARLSPQFAEVVRRDLPVTHPMFSTMGQLKSVTFLGHGERGGDVYDLVFANGGAIMSAGLETDGRMAGGMLQPMAPPAR